ncbi:MAG: Acyltransferase domain protein [Chthoniobacteraceae bacterium]|nr:Acyltransferase domain protein [Chthoniobacteraceae bacterium]
MQRLMSTSLSNPAVVPKERMVWLDLFRGAAVVMMIEAHVINTFLSDLSKSSVLFSWLNFFNGLVAPSFLFIAGYLQGLGMQRNRGNVPVKKWLRLLGLAAIGYALHAPTELLQTGQFTEALRVGSQVDILQCLAVSLALLLAVQRWAGKAGALVLAVCLALIVGCAAFLSDWHGVPVPLRAFINASTGSLFPLFPWTGFVIAGALAAQAGVKSTQPGAGFARNAAIDFALPGAFFFLGYIILAPFPYATLGIPFFIQRLAWVLGAAWMAKWMTSRIRPRWLQLAGRESLVMYVGHLVLICCVAGWGVAQLDFSMAWRLYGALLAATWLLAWTRSALVSLFKPAPKPVWIASVPEPA